MNSENPKMFAAAPGSPAFREGIPSFGTGVAGTSPAQAPEILTEPHENDDYINYLLSQTKYECCLCRAKELPTPLTWATIRRDSVGAADQKYLPDLACAACSSKAPCSKCRYDLGPASMSLQPTSTRFKVADDEKERRFYFFMCCTCGRAKEVLPKKTENPKSTVPLPLGRKLSFRRSQAPEGSCFVDFGKQECFHCRHSACKLCVCFEAPNPQTRAGERGKIVRKTSRASKILSAVASLSVVKNGENPNETPEIPPPVMTAKAGPDVHFDAGLNRKNTAIETPGPNSRRDRRARHNVNIPKLNEVVEAPKVSPPDPEFELRPGTSRRVSDP